MPHNVLASQTVAQTGDDTAKRMVRSTLVSRNITVAGRRTSVRLEPQMWEGLRELCQRERCNMHKICTSIALQKDDPTSLTAAIRVYVMGYFRCAATEEGHSKAGHGHGMMLGIGAQTRAATMPPANMQIPFVPRSYLSHPGKGR